MRRSSCSRCRASLVCTSISASFFVFRTFYILVIFGNICTYVEDDRSVRRKYLYTYVRSYVFVCTCFVQVILYVRTNEVVSAIFVLIYSAQNRISYPFNTKI